MKLAIVGSRGITKIDVAPYIPCGVTEIVSGGARGVDTLAREYAAARGIPLVEFLPQYERYGRAAPLKRNAEIAAYGNKVGLLGRSLKRHSKRHCGVSDQRQKGHRGYRGVTASVPRLLLFSMRPLPRQSRHVCREAREVWEPPEARGLSERSVCPLEPRRPHRHRRSRNVARPHVETAAKAHH